MPRQPSSRGNLSTSPPGEGKCWKSSLEATGFDLLSTLFCTLVVIPFSSTPVLSIKDFKRKELRETCTALRIEDTIQDCFKNWHFLLWPACSPPFSFLSVYSLIIEPELIQAEAPKVFCWIAVGAARRAVDEQGQWEPSALVSCVV